MSLSKEDILSVKDMPTEMLYVPEWGGDVIVATIPAYERDRYEQQMVGMGKGSVIENFRARLIARCLVDDDGKRMFSDTEVVLLGKKSAKAMDRIFEVCQRLNGFSDKDIDELEKNSEAVQGDDSVSD